MRTLFVARVVILGLLFLAPCGFTSAQDGRSYYYQSIDQTFTVNTDTTVDVEETQTYRFNGAYHKGWRSISLNKVSDITDVRVFDDAGNALIRANTSLNKDDPNSWGKYFVSRSDGNLNIEWYYDAKDESRAWVLRYKLIGALSFLMDKDELYWNILTDYTVPVVQARATVIIPANIFALGNLQSSVYAENASSPTKEIFDNQHFIFSAINIKPYGKVTIAAGWPVGLLDRNAFWGQFVIVHIVPIVSVAMVIATLLIMFIYWYRTEVRGKGRGTIVPEYEPPRRLPPAMAEVIVREKVTPKGWAATVVDLAVKGYLDIEEDKNTFWAGLRFVGLLIPALILIFIMIQFGRDFTRDVAGILPFFIFIAVAMSLAGRHLKKNLGSSLLPKDYTIVLKKDYHGAVGLEDYEKKFMTTLLTGGRFSTKAMRWDKKRARELYQAMQSLQKELYTETEIDTGAYEKPLSKDSFAAAGLFVLFFGAIFMIPLGMELSQTGRGPLILAILAGLCALAIFLFTRFEARLSAEGAILKEEWLGFKMYLETAERYRMQNLTPDIFEKFLPYAIIFGVEKQWGKAFEGIAMPAPSWYHGSIGSSSNFGGSSGGFTSGFSAGAFSSSFASSFTSAFSSSGGAGASGGGGGAGGGGGGGGGGAS